MMQVKGKKCRGKMQEEGINHLQLIKLSYFNGKPNILIILMIFLILKFFFQER